MTIAEKLTELISVKKDIRRAISTITGEDPGDDFSTYADYIRAYEPAGDYVIKVKSDNPVLNWIGIDSWSIMMGSWLTAKELSCVTPLRVTQTAFDEVNNNRNAYVNIIPSNKEATYVEYANMYILKNGGSGNMIWHFLPNLSGIGKLDLGELENIDYAISYYYGEYLDELELICDNPEKITSLDFLFHHCENLKSLNLDFISKFKSIIRLNSFLESCKSLEYIDISPLAELPDLTSTQSMFNKCESLKSIDLRPLSDKLITNMPYMFYQCKSLEEVDLSPLFRTGISYTVNEMFNRCTNLHTVDFGSDDLLLRGGMVFYNCSSIKYVKCTTATKESLIEAGNFNENITWILYDE